MNPTLTVDLDYLRSTAHRLSARLRESGIELLGVTKAVDGEPAVGRAFLEGGCAGLADSRLPALRRLAEHGLGPRTFIRAPQPDEIEAVARDADRVFLSRPEVARALGEHAAGRPLEIVLTVDLGDRREGVLPEHAAAVAAEIAAAPGVSLAGVAVNFACLSGQLPSHTLFRQAEEVLAGLPECFAAAPCLSLGGTCCLQYVDGYQPRFRTEMRSGVALLHGWDIVSASAIEGLEARDPILAATVLECQRKPPAPEGLLGRDAFGREPDVRLPQEDAWYALIHVGRRDCEPHGMRPLIDGAWIAGMTSDVAVLVVPEPLATGDEVSFALDYEALVRAITSPFVTRRFVPQEDAAAAATWPPPHVG